MEGDTYVIGAQRVQEVLYYKTLFSCIVKVRWVEPRSVDQDLKIKTNHGYVATVHIYHTSLTIIPWA